MRIWLRLWLRFSRLLERVACAACRAPRTDWALTTLTTVGYGDITPTNDLERLYSLFALLTGALVFGYMLSSIGSLVAAIDRQAALSEERMDEIKEYMRWRQLPRDLVVRLRRYYIFYYSRKTAFDEEMILGGLTPALRLEANLTLSAPLLARSACGRNVAK